MRRVLDRPREGDDLMLKQYAPLILLVPLAFFIGRWTGAGSGRDAPRMPDPGCEPVASAAPSSGSPASPLAVSPAASAGDAADREGIDLMGAVSELLADLWHRQPVQVVDVVTHMMSDDELSSAVTSLTNLTNADLAEVDDLRAFSSRLAGIAAEGLLTDLEDADYAEVERIEFFRAGDDTAQSTFRSSESRIIAEYPLPQNGASRILVKWIQEQPYELMQFRRRNVDPGGGYSSSSAQRIGGWAEGTYRVQIFALNDAVDLLAEGRFDVVSDSGSSQRPAGLQSRN